MKTKRKGPIAFFVIFALILAFTYAAFFGFEDYYGDTRKLYVKGAKDIRWGIDIRGGVEAVFSPDTDDDEITDRELEAAKTIIEKRLVNKSITDSEVYIDSAKNQIIVRFPWAADESNFNAQEAVQELGATAQLAFYQGSDNSSGQPFMTGKVVTDSTVQYVNMSENGSSSSSGYQYVVTLDLDSEGASAFANATATAAANNSQISIYMDDTRISSAGCDQAITGGKAIISGNFTAESATELSNQINAGSLPFSLTVDDSKMQVISPTLGSNALSVMVIAGSIAFGVVCLLMIIRYRVNGFVAAIALLGQLAGTIACISGFFGSAQSHTLTIPGIAGIILSIGVGVDCNVIASERIKDEFRKGKTIDGAIDSGFKNSLSAIIDGNVTIVIVSIVLMGAFGTENNIFAKVFSALMPFLGASITGSIYSFGYTLLVGVVFNLIMGVLASKYMLKSISKAKFLRNPALYGGKKNG